MQLNDIITKQDLLEFEKRIQQKLESILSSNSGFPKKQWLRNKDLKEMLGLSDGTIQNLRVNGTLKYTKLGGLYFYRLSDVEEILEKNFKKN